jgi:hypothetical protein
MTTRRYNTAGTLAYNRSQAVHAEAVSLLAVERNGCNGRCHARCRDITTTLRITPKQEATLMEFAAAYPEDAGWMPGVLAFRRDVLKEVARLRRLPPSVVGDLVGSLDDGVATLRPGDTNETHHD